MTRFQEDFVTLHADKLMKHDMKTKKKKTTSANSPIKIRFRKLSDGRQSIFFDSTVCNLATGEENKSERHTYKFLGLFLVPESTPCDAQSNKQTLQLVEDMVRQMTEKYSRERLGVISRHASKGNFVENQESIPQHGTIRKRVLHRPNDLPKDR